jgi:hypothetical protein
METNEMSEVHLFEERVYRPLSGLPTPCYNEVWQLCTWDDKKKVLVPDHSLQAKLYKTGTTQHAMSYEEEAGCYTGGFPSQQCVNFLNGMKDKMLHNDDGNRFVYSKYIGR